MITAGDRSAEVIVVMLHGRDMSAADLAPFAHSLGVAAYFVFPDGPLPTARGRTWWPIDSEARIRNADLDPPGRGDARALLGGVLATLPDRPIVLAGFSQGGMLAMDHVLHGGRRPAALALLSSTRIAIADWLPRAPILAGLPVLVAHGRTDPQLAFAAGEQLRDFARAGGASVTWLPFDGGHELPLVVWRALRKLVVKLRA